MQIQEEVDSINIELYTMYEAQANSPSTQTMGALTADATTVMVTDCTVFPDVPFLLTFGYDRSTAETVLVTNIDGPTGEITIVRGVDGPAQQWDAGTNCARIFTAKDLNDVQKNLDIAAMGIDDARIAATLILIKQGLINDNFVDVNAQVTPQNGQVTLTNSLKYPFNNSEVTVPLPHAVSNMNYLIDTEVISHNGNVGEIVITDKLVNGFKMSFTGSATSVTVKYVVIGGTL